MAPSRELSFVLCGDHFISLVVGFFLLDISLVSRTSFAMSGFFISRPPSRGETGGECRKRSGEGTREGEEKHEGYLSSVLQTRQHRSTEAFVLNRERGLVLVLSSLHCAQYKTDREETRFFLGFCGRGFRLSLTSDPPSPPNLSLFSCCCALDRGSCIRT